LNSRKKSEKSEDTHEISTRTMGVLNCVE